MADKVREILEYILKSLNILHPAQAHGGAGNNSSHAAICRVVWGIHVGFYGNAHSVYFIICHHLFTVCFGYIYHLTTD